MPKTDRAPTLGDLRKQREEILRIASAYGASNVRVFGSVARGQARRDSDVDLLVDIESDRRGFQFFAVLEDLGRALEERLGYPVDIGEAVEAHARESVMRDLVSP